MKQGKKFISPGAWFSMVYPADWNEFEDGEGSFLFYNPNEWTGNFRISAYKGDTAYGRESVKQELKENTSATLVKIGRLDCAYSKEMFEEEGTYYTSHLWIAGIDDVAFECSFTVRKGEPVAEPACRGVPTTTIRSAPPKASRWPKWASTRCSTTSRPAPP